MNVFLAIGSRMVVVAALICAAGLACGQADATEKSKPVKSIAPWKAGDAVAFVTPGLAVDADGAPNSYLVDGNGLSRTCDGVVAIVDGKRVTPKTDKLHWQAICEKAWADAKASGDYSHVGIFGFLADKGKPPVVQGAGDPLPGKAYVTVTSMTIPKTPDRTQRHWVDATRIPYIVLPPDFTSGYKVSLGQLAVVYWPKKDRYAFAVFADGGDRGEASVKLHEDLKSTPVVKDAAGVMRAKAGIGDPVLTVVFPAVRVPASADADEWYGRIQVAGKAALEQWGGAARLQACSKGPEGTCSQ